MAVPVTWAKTQLCTLADVKQRVSDLAIPLLTSDVDTINGEVSSAIAVAKEWIRVRLMTHFNLTFPTTVGDAMSRNRRRIREVREAYAAQFELADIDSIVPTAENGLFSDSGFSQFYLNFTSLSPVRPRTFNQVKAPVNGTSGSYAGSCNIGDFLCDFNSYTLYINTGADDPTTGFCLSPVWVKFIPETMIDFISNPDILRAAAVSGTVVACYESGITRARSDLAAYVPMLTQERTMWNDRYNKDLDLALGLIKVNTAGDGNLSPFDEEANRRDWLLI